MGWSEKRLPPAQRPLKSGLSWDFDEVIQVPYNYEIISRPRQGMIKRHPVVTKNVGEHEICDGSLLCRGDSRHANTIGNDSHLRRLKLCCRRNCEPGARASFGIFSRRISTAIRPSSRARAAPRQ